MKAVSVWSLAIIAAVYAWVVAASAIYCSLAGMSGAFEFPWLQWIDAAPWWRYSLWNTVYVVVSAAFPTIITGAAVVLWWQHAQKPTRQREAASQPLYGDRRLATDADLRDGGIT